MLGLRALIGLSEAVAWADKHRVKGIILEAGTGWGGSALVLAASRQAQRPLYLYDTFEGIPPPTQVDGQVALTRFAEIRAGLAKGVRGRIYYGYENRLVECVRQLFADYGMPVASSSVYLVRGLYQDTLYPPDSVAVAHLDCDWYESTKVCLERIVPLLSIGGRLIVDDYDYWPGCKQAVDEYFADKKSSFTFTRLHKLHIVRHS